MEMTLTIEEFHKLLTSEENETPLLSALRKLTGIEEPEEITRLAAEPLEHWAGWSW